MPSITPAAGSVAREAPDAIANPRLFHRTRPLKRWRYVGIFCEELMACAALVQIGPGRQSFWALHMRDGSGLRERTRLLPRRAELQLVHGRPAGEGEAGVPGVLRLRDRGVLLELTLAEDGGIEALCANGRSHVWTRKQAGVLARGQLSLDGRGARAIEALAVIDDTIGYHARVTEWRWSAGVGTSIEGVPVAWNLVSGVNDPAHHSERAVWIDRLPFEPPPVSFDDELATIRCEDGSVLRFRAEAERSRRENLLVLSSDYRAPFGSFSGALPGGIELASGLGVMEHHRARW